MEKTIKLTAEQARGLLGKSPEMDELIKANFSEEELREGIRSWEDLGEITGFYINSMSDIRATVINEPTDTCKNVFATENQARSALAMAQLSQLMLREWGDWRPKWNKTLYTITCAVDDGKFILTKSEDWYYPSFLAFPTEEMRDRFLENHRELIEEYFLKYQY